MYLKTILKEKKTVLLLILFNMSLEVELSKKMSAIANFYNDKNNEKRP